MHGGRKREAYRAREQLQAPRATAVDGIAEDRTSKRRTVNPDLMRPTCRWREFQPGTRTVDTKTAPSSDRERAVRCRLHAP